jgi:small subunit ribosomal protein S9
MSTNLKSVLNKNTIGLGKRKRSIARVFLVPGEGHLIINKVSGEKYLQYNTNYLTNIWAPLKTLNLQNQFNIVALVCGGGLTGQADAIQLGVSRLICKLDAQNRKVLKPFGFLSRDSRIKERKKYGLRKARKASQYSKR